MNKENDIFHFKQFSVKQHPSVFRINTDGCLLGAVISKQSQTHQATNKETHRILDIGTGTGVVALMLAQNCKGQIDAIDINSKAVELASYNFLKSKWYERLHSFHADLANFTAKDKNGYHCIVSNPPFFSNSLKSPNQLRNQSKHNDILSLENLCDCTSQLLLKNGLFYIILPPKEATHFIKISKDKKLYLQLKIHVKSVIHKRVFRNILIFSKINTGNLEEKTIILQEKNGEYTREYKALIKDFFLYF